MFDWASFFRDFTDADLAKYIADKEKSIAEYQEQIDSIDSRCDPCDDSWLLGNARHSYWTSQQEVKHMLEEAKKEQNLRAALPRDKKKIEELEKQLEAELDTLDLKKHEDYKRFNAIYNDLFRLIRIQFNRY